MKPSTFKTVGALAILASTTAAHALIAPGRPVHKACIEIGTSESGATYADDCDQTANNKKLNKELNPETGCAAGQAKFTSVQVKLPACMPVGVVQL